jgi:pimeloyl-ACP methyl ester carboxylesterase
MLSLRTTMHVSGTPDAPLTRPPSRDLVVLVHGLWMSGPVCALLARRLRACRFEVASFSYRSVAHPLETSAAGLRAFVRARAPGRVHFVAHSLGGLLVLHALAQDAPQGVGRVVLLGSPCMGCAAAEQLARSARGRALLGRALPGWNPDRAKAVVQRFEVGAIAGTRRLGIGMLLVRLEPPDDGVVRVEETRIPGLKDHVVLPVTHSGMLVSGRVAALTAAFLAEGRFPEPRGSL